ncbi:MAG: hypothetical protein Q9212_005215, partial [Teloschistes hypoglaucus]
MTSSTTVIRPLPDHVAAQIKSSTAITSLENVVVELFKNSLDAGSRRIDIAVDFARGTCAVEDDGLGIIPGEFLDTGGLGKAFRMLEPRLACQNERSLMYVIDTSKDGESRRLHGRGGIFLASLAAMSILTITSHHHAHRSSATLILHHTRPAARLIPAPSHIQLMSRENGTKVDVHDLFGNMPVRVKQRRSGYEKDHIRGWESMCKSIVGLLLAWQAPVDTIIKNRNTDRKVMLRRKAHSPLGSPTGSSPFSPLDLARICSLLVHAGYIEPDDQDTWIKTSARTPFITVRGAFSLQPAPTKRTQFISLGIRHISADDGTSILYDEINKVFALSSFGNLEDGSDDEAERRRKSGDRRYKKDGPTNKQIRGGGKGIDRWPMFVIWIDMQDNLSGRVGVQDMLEQESTLTSIVKVLAAMTTGFLSDYHFRPRKLHKKRRLISSRDQSSQSKRVGWAWMKDGGESSSKSSPPAEPTNAQTSSKEVDEGAPTFCGGDVFYNNVQVPKIRVDRTKFHGGFNTWSRMKTSSSRGIEDGFLIEATKSETGVRSRDLPADRLTIGSELTKGQVGNTSPGTLSPTVQHDPSNADHAQTISDMSIRPRAEELETDQAAETTITWTNPITQAPMLVNARTGQVMPLASNRPASGSNTPMGQRSAHGNQITRLKTLTRAPSTPSIAKSGSWINNFLKDWQNPVFTPATEPAIPQVSFEGPMLDSHNNTHANCLHRSIEHAFSDASSSNFVAKLSKSGLRDARVIAQVDKKFVLILMSPSRTHGDEAEKERKKERVLVLVDQHAADERIRVEDLLEELCTEPEPEAEILMSTSFSTDWKPGVKTTMLAKPLTFQIKAQEHALFESRKQHLADWGILYNLSPPLSLPPHPSTPLSSSKPKSEAQRCRIAVKALPPVIAERCRAEPKLLVELLRTEIWKSASSSFVPQATHRAGDDDDDERTKKKGGDWLKQITSCPRGILDMLNSRACRSAVMFNDALTGEECGVLVKRLSG